MAAASVLARADARRIWDCPAARLRPVRLLWNVLSIAISWHHFIWQQGDRARWSAGAYGAVVYIHLRRRSLREAAAHVEWPRRGVISRNSGVQKTSLPRLAGKFFDKLNISKYVCDDQARRGRCRLPAPAVSRSATLSDLQPARGGNCRRFHFSSICQNYYSLKPAAAGARSDTELPSVYMDTSSVSFTQMRTIQPDCISTAGTARVRREQAPAACPAFAYSMFSLITYPCSVTSSK